jgi:tetratricopeptide (TPR) repeat protein
MNAAVISPSLSPVEAEVRRIRELLERNQFAAALHAAELLAVKVPENRDVLYMMAVSQRFLKRIPDALATLERLQAHHPTFSRLYQERGYCQVALRDAPRAIEAFLTGVHINPALPASWRTLHSLYRMSGEAENAEMAAAHVETLAKLPPEIVTATALFCDGDLAPAEVMIRAYLLEHGDHVEAMRLLARIGLQRDVLDDADILLEAVLAKAPDYRAARYDYAMALLRRHKHVESLAELDKLLQLEPGNRVYRTTRATAQVGLGDHEGALELYRELVSGAEGAVQSSELHLSIAHSLKALGRRQEAIDAYRAAAAARPSYGDAYWSLANLKTYGFAAEEIERMRAQEAAPATALVDRFHLCFALGKALEDLGDYAESFRYYDRGNALKKSQSGYRPEPVERNTRLQRAVCTRGFFAAREAAAAPGAAAPGAALAGAPGAGRDAVRDAVPIFVVGLPRSGSTLLEQILASHSKVEGTMELADIPRMVLELQGREADSEDPRYPRVLAEMKPEDFRRLGEKYLADTRIYRTGKPFFIDKMPNNFRHLGLIHLILPNARIIDARRNAMACCFSNFKQLFAAGQEFTYSLEDIGRYYRTYVELMAHWDAVLPGRVLRVEHEDVVENLDANVRRILDFCGLDFEPQCLEFYKTERSIRTASSEQVRRPIFREGLDQWRNFEPWLAPLKAVLGWPPQEPA